MVQNLKVLNLELIILYNNLLNDLLPIDVHFEFEELFDEGQ